ncbi:unnamed protein product [Pieris brassicae]|uniref:Uncharacterized protein n=1 Tax=Pieris brassicae TaxID=7116 RepID=A0A9P0TQ17_PIEBR|nr:unnamed protein product [Pieris brassicae]
MMEKSHSEERLTGLEREFSSSSSLHRRDLETIAEQQAVVDRLWQLYNVVVDTEVTSKQQNNMMQIKKVESLISLVINYIIAHELCIRLEQKTNNSQLH